MASSSAHRRRRRWLYSLAGILGVFIAVALAAPLIAPYNPYDMNPDEMLAAPSPEHPFGTDAFGRDIFSRIIFGVRISLQVALTSTAFALVAGGLLGVAAGYFGGRTDQILSRIVDSLFSFPDILLALALLAVLGPKTINLIIAIGIVYTPIFARIARAASLEVRSVDFIAAARTVGARSPYIIARHVLPSISPPLIVQTTLSIAFAILAEAALSFLGQGVEPDSPSWGIMLNEGKDWMELAWWVAVFPGLAITLAVLAFNLLGDRLRDVLDPRQG